ALVTGRDDFGLMLERTAGHRTLGPVGILIENCRTLGQAVAEGARYLHLHNAALKYSLEPCGEHYVYRAEIDARGRYAPRHYIEPLLSTSVGFFRHTLGPDWPPVTVTMTHARIGSPAASARAPGCPVAFGRE